MPMVIQALSGAEHLKYGPMAPWKVGIIDCIPSADNSMKLLMQLRRGCPSAPVVAMRFSIEHARVCS